MGCVWYGAPVAVKGQLLTVISPPSPSTFCGVNNLHGLTSFHGVLLRAEWISFSGLAEYLPRAEWGPSQCWVVCAYCFVKFYCNIATKLICLSAASSVLLEVPIAVMKHHDNKQPGDEGVSFICTSTWLFIINWSHWGNSNRAETVSQELMQIPWSGLVLHGLLILSSSSQDHQPRGGHHTQWVGLSTPIVITN